MTPVGTTPPARTAWVLSPDMRQRAVFGAVMAAVALVCNFSGRLPFAVLVAVAAAVVAWEWGRLVRRRSGDTVLAVHVLVTSLAALLAALGMAALGLVLVVAGAIAVVPLGYGLRPYLSALGLIYTGVPTVALLWLHGAGEHGSLAILMIYVVVWATDISALIAGRSIGGARLWPSISPNKTWAGAIGGLAGAVLAAVLFAVATAGAPTVALALKAVVLSAVSQLGDLAESALKRAFGAKDASKLIPGHGGLLDRIDGFVAAATLAAIISLCTDVQAPARALVFGQ